MYNIVNRVGFLKAHYWYDKEMRRSLYRKSIVLDVHRSAEYYVYFCRLPTRKLNGKLRNAEFSGRQK